MIGGATAAYERIVPGILVALAFFSSSRNAPPESREPRAWPRAWPWIIGNALAGPSIGVAVYQWGVATTPTGILMPIVATVPVLTQFLAWKIEGHHPDAAHRRSAASSPSPASSRSRQRQEN